MISMQHEPFLRGVQQPTGLVKQSRKLLKREKKGKHSFPLPNALSHIKGAQHNERERRQRAATSFTALTPYMKVV